MQIVKSRLSTKLEYMGKLPNEDLEWIDHAFACFGFILPVGSHSFSDFIRMIGEYSHCNKAKAVMFVLTQIADRQTTDATNNAPLECIYTFRAT